jgi:hypothetical protein
MAAGATYEPIATQTLASTATSVSFTSIAATYTDIVLVAAGTASTATGVFVRVNNDSGSNYSFTQLQGDGTTATSSRSTAQNKAGAGSWYTTQSNSIVQFQNYANATTYKTFLTRMNNAGNLVEATVSLWRNTAAINRIDIAPGFGANTFSIGSTFTLYGIAAA